MKQLAFRKTLFISFLVLTIIGVLNTTVVITNELAGYDDIDFFYPFLYEMTGTYTFFLIFPVLYWLFVYHPITRLNWKSHIPIYLGFYLVTGIVHTMMMWGSRLVIFWLFDLGQYDYGIMKYRILMEYSKQFISFWFIYGVFQSLRYFMDREEEKRKRNQVEQDLLRVQLVSLEKQMNPHFLFNTLNAISSTMYQSIDKADQMIAVLSDLLRRTIRREPTQATTLRDELTFIDDYMRLMKLRFGSRLNYQCEVEKNLLDMSFPFLLLQPLIENSIRHGVEHVTGDVLVEVQIQRKDERLHIQIRDNGPGFKSGEVEEGFGIGHTRSRLRHMFGEKFELQIHSDQGVHIQLSFPAFGDSHV